MAAGCSCELAVAAAALAVLAASAAAVVGESVDINRPRHAPKGQLVSGGVPTGVQPQHHGRTAAATRPLPPDAGPPAFVDDAGTHTMTFRAPVLVAATPGSELTADGFAAVHVDDGDDGDTTLVYGPGHWTSHDSGRTWTSALPKGGLDMLPDTGWAGEPSAFPLPGGDGGSGSGGVHGLGAIMDCPPPGCWSHNHTRADCVNVTAWVVNRNRAWAACGGSEQPPPAGSQEWLTTSPVSGAWYKNDSDGLLWSSSTCGRAVRFRGLPLPLNSSLGMCNGFTQPTRVSLADGSQLATFALVFRGEHGAVNDRNESITAHHLPMSLVVFRSVDGGFMWDFQSVAVNYTQIPGMPPGLPNPYNLTHSAYGPQENGMALLSDNKTVVIVFRPDTDSMCPGGPVPYKFYYQVYSADGGKTWSDPTPIHGVGCVRPRLHRLPGGPLLLTGGRLCPTLVPNASFAGHGCLPQSSTGQQGGLLLWANLNGMADAPAGRGKGGSEWRTYCLGAIHNRLWTGDPKYRFVNCTGTAPCGSQTYNSIVPLGPSSVGVFYQNGYNGPSSSTWMMRVDVAPQRRGRD